MQRKSRYLADIINERIIAVRQGLQSEHLAACVRPHRDAIGDRVTQELIQWASSALVGAFTQRNRMRDPFAPST